MATDWLFYYMTLPTGLAVIALAVALPFLVWRLVLGKAFSGVGFKPLASAYAFAALGLLALNFVSSHVEFSSRVANNVLPETQRWATVPGWTIYITVLSLIAVLPLLGLVGVPAAALLLRLRRLSIVSVAAALVATWLVLVLIVWSFPSNDWHRTHRLDSLAMWLTEIGPSVLLVGLPFLGGIYLTSKGYRSAET